MDAASITALAGLVTQAAGSVTSATATKESGDAAARAAAIQAAGVTYRGETNATIGEYRAGLTEWAAQTNQNFAMARADRIESVGEVQAAQAKAEAAAQADIINRSTSRVMGRATAAFGAAGVTGGSTLYVLNDIATEGELQSNLAIYGGKLKADWTTYGAAVQASDIRTQAKIDTQAAEGQATIYRTMAQAERVNASIGAAALYAGGAAKQDAATMAAGTTLMTGLGKVATGVGDLFDKGSKTPASFDANLKSGLPELGPGAAAATPQGAGVANY
jgi:hypothetical protein